MKIKYMMSLASAAFLGFASLSAHADQITFPLSRTSTPNNPQQFYCTVTKTGTGDEIVRLTNWGQMVKGFDVNGVLLIKPEDLNKVYFLAYHDPNPNYKDEDGNVVVSAAGFKAQCNYGEGTGRKLIDGPYG